MIIDFYADLLDAWAAIAWYRLHRVIDVAVADGGTDPYAAGRPVTAADDVETATLQLRWRPYLLDPTAPSVSASLLEDDPVHAALQQSESGVAAAIRKLEARLAADEEGWGSPFDARRRVSSWAAHRLVTAAADDLSVQRRLVDDLLQAHFVADLDINRVDVLAGLADRYGLPQPIPDGDTGAALVYLQPGVDPEDPTERATREALLFGRAAGVQRSPALVVEDQVLPVAPETDDPERLLAAAAEPAGGGPVPAEVRRLRAGSRLLERRDPRGALYLLAPLRPEYDGERSLEILTARALFASASLSRAQAVVEPLLERMPDDAYLNLLMGRILQRRGDPGAARYLALAAALDPDLGTE